MSDFLYNLGTIVDQQFNLSDNKQNTLDTVQGGKITRYGKLGDFTNKFDHSAERRYYEEGFTKHSMTPKVFEVLSQEPDLTVVIKKKEFSSLKVNNKTQFLDKKEKLFLKAASILFRNKCQQIAMYERLTKIERIAQLQKNIDYGLMPILLDTFDAAQSIPGLSNLFSGNFSSAMEEIRKLVAYNKPAYWTTWTEDPNRLFKSTYGTGTGVIELTTVSSVSTQSGIRWGSGSCQVTIEDPYRLMRITENDIELAISEAFNPIARSQFVNIEKDSTTQLIDRNKSFLNQKRAARGANPINFIVNPDTYLGKRIRVLIDGIGQEINFSDSSNIDFLDSKSSDPASSIGDFLSGKTKKQFDPSIAFGPDGFGIQGLKDDELELISTIIDYITSLISLDTNVRNQTKKTNKDTNKLRKRMMLHYCNNSIIQPMDVVHIYMNSKSKIDNKIVGGLQSAFTGFGFLQNISQQVNDLKQQFNSVFNPSNAASEIEKSVFVGKDFPSYLWALMRNQFVTDKAGTHVFAGVVQVPTSAMPSPGHWTLSFGCEDNTSYFKMGNVNQNPSIESANGPLMDPITPFDIQLDSITGAQREVPKLLDENKKFYSSAAPKYVAGALAGKSATETNFSHQDSSSSAAGQQYLSNFTQNIFYPPDGTVYHWKEGIGTLTLSRSTYGNGYDTSIPAQTIPRATTEEAFAGQDIMNVISLLITGQAYNFATFYKTILQTDQFKQDYFNDPSFFRNLQLSLQKNNQLWGDFQPFKKLIMSEASFAKIMSGTLSVEAANTQLDDLLQRRSQTYDRLAIAGAGSGPGVGLSQLSLTQVDNQQLIDLNNQIAEAQKAIGDAIGSGAKNYQIFGDDISFDVDSFSGTNDQQNVLNDPSIRKELRRKTNFLTRRLFYKVKANEDQNLFIVDDTYDKDLELQAYSKSIGNNFSLFVNDYDDVSNQISTVAEKLDFEVFADSQGHIQARPPQFNKVPNSIFNKLLKNKEDNGIQIFPQFLQDLYSNQLQAFFQNIEVVENQIRLYAAALSIDTDARITSDLITDDDATGRFQFLSDEQTGKIGNIDIVNIIANPDENNVNQITDLTATVEQQATQVRFAYSSAARSNFLVNRFSLGTNAIPYPKFANNGPELQNRVDIVTRNLSFLGVQAESISKLFQNDGKLLNGGASAMDVLRITKQIAQMISTRQRLVKSAASALKTVRDSLRTTLDSTSVGSDTANKISFPNLYSQQGVPEVLEHMIEDESYDDLGPGSGQRYVINDYQILSMSFSESPPQFNFIQVNGLFGGQDGFFKEGEGPNGLGLSNGGNALTTAYAVDYDLWRMYGFRKGQTIPINSLSDPDSQLAPYAVGLLNRARGEIKTGVCTIVGNEYQQAGEVVYIEDTNMLWYVESVQHSFNYGGNFTTTLQLTHGHNPGEYIPTAFDIVGKVLYKNKDYSNNVVVKGENAYNEQSIGALCFDTAVLNSSDPSEAFAGKNGNAKSNINTVQNIQYSVVGIVNPNNVLSAVPKIEVRIFSYKINGTLNINNNLSIQANYLVSLLTRTASTKDLEAIYGKDIPLAFPASQVKVVSVDVSDPTEHRSPSQKAWEMARSLANESGSNSSASEQEKLVNGVIDIWLSFEDQ